MSAGGLETRGLGRTAFGRRIRGVDPMVALGILALAGFAATLLVSRQIAPLLPPAPLDGPFAAGAPRYEARILCGSLTPHHVLQGQVWRMFTALFLHADLLHLILNGVAFVQLGRLVRGMASNTAFIAVFGITGFFASVASLGWQVARLSYEGFSLHLAGGSVGASGAICGLGGFALGVLHGRSDPLSGALRRSLVVWVAMLVLLGLTGLPIDNAGHFGGLIAGLLLGVLAPRTARVRALLGRRAAGVVAALVLASAAAALAFGLGPWGRDARAALALRGPYLAVLAVAPAGAERTLPADVRERLDELAADPATADGARAIAAFLADVRGEGPPATAGFDALGARLVALLGPASGLDVKDGGRLR